MFKSEKTSDAWDSSSLRNPHAAQDKPRRIRLMFNRLARRYDVMNRIISMGRDQAWRRLVVQMSDLRQGESVLDVACGTGDLAAAFAEAGAGEVIGLDFAESMLKIARDKYAGMAIDWINGDATQLPYNDARFDVVSVGFGLRNLSNTSAGLREIVRVLRPGGRAAVLELSRPRGVVNRVLMWLLSPLAPLIGGIVSGNWSAYRYLTASARTYLSYDEMRLAMQDAGLIDIQSRRLAFGAVAVHVGKRP